MVFAPFLADFDFFAVFLREVDFAFLRPPDDVVDAEDVLADFFLDRRSDVVALATDLSAFIGVPLRISSPIDSAVLATGLFPRADCSPTIAPATPPAIAPTGPPTIAPSTAPVTPPTACLETEMFFSAGAFDDGRVAFFLDFLAIVLPLVVLNLISSLRKAQVLRRYHNRCNSRRAVASAQSRLTKTTSCPAAILHYGYDLINVAPDTEPESDVAETIASGRGPEAKVNVQIYDSSLPTVSVGIARHRTLDAIPRVA